MLPTARKLAFADVPVIDLAAAWSGDAAAYRTLADQIADACGRVGFMYIRNHSILDRFQILAAARLSLARD
jgi:isopenicillin N synthase-like dioxygenase